MEEATTPTRRTSKKAVTPYRIYLISVIGVAVLIGGGYFGWTKYQEMYNSPAAQEQAAVEAAEKEKKEVLDKLSKLMVLPEGDPVLFKVSDKDQMRQQQAFFKDTENEDILLVFQQSSKAVIFRPSTNVIVNVGPINFDQTADNAASQSTPSNTGTSTRR